ncbi:nesprin-2 [Protopterus annectens]|uniref:nesprin-2 n=1 Tax=Protopterus annectens TaxID=7888 RepID=UPI001CFC0E41|nr:nesprin-2 [Protopterus annectens]
MASGDSQPYVTEEQSSFNIDSVHHLLQAEQEETQKKTFTKWINAQLAKHHPSSTVVDLFTDLSDGHKILDLLEVLSGQQLPREKGHAGIFQSRSNIEYALEYLKKSVKLVNVHVADITEGNPSIILGLIWTIILHFQIQEVAGILGLGPQPSLPEFAASSDASPTASPPAKRSAKIQSKWKLSAKQALLSWVKEQCSKSEAVPVNDFTSSWRNGLAFLAVIHSLRPELINMEEAYQGSNRENLELAFRIAEQKLKIPKLIEPEDVDVAQPDEKSVMTYIAQFLQYSKDSSVAEQELQATPEPVSEDQALFASDSTTSKSFTEEALDLLTCSCDLSANNLKTIIEQVENMDIMTIEEEVETLTCLPKKTAKKRAMLKKLKEQLAEIVNKRSAILKSMNELLPAVEVMEECIKKMEDLVSCGEEHINSITKRELRKEEKEQYLQALDSYKTACDYHTAEADKALQILNEQIKMSVIGSQLQTDGLQTRLTEAKDAVEGTIFEIETILQKCQYSPSEEYCIRRNFTKSKQELEAYISKAVSLLSEKSEPDEFVKKSEDIYIGNGNEVLHKFIKATEELKKISSEIKQQSMEEKHHLLKIWEDINSKLSSCILQSKFEVEVRKFDKSVSQIELQIKREAESIPMVTAEKLLQEHETFFKGEAGITFLNNILEAMKEICEKLSCDEKYKERTEQIAECEHKKEKLEKSLESVHQNLLAHLSKRQSHEMCGVPPDSAKDGVVEADMEVQPFSSDASIFKQKESSLDSTSDDRDGLSNKPLDYGKRIFEDTTESLEYDKEVSAVSPQREDKEASLKDISESYTAKRNALESQLTKANDVVISDIPDVPVSIPVLQEMLKTLQAVQTETHCCFADFENTVPQMKSFFKKKKKKRQSLSKTAETLSAEWNKVQKSLEARSKSLGAVVDRLGAMEHDITCLLESFQQFQKTPRTLKRFALDNSDLFQKQLQDLQNSIAMQMKVCNNKALFKNEATNGLTVGDVHAAWKVVRNYKSQLLEIRSKVQTTGAAHLSVESFLKSLREVAQSLHGQGDVHSSVVMADDLDEAQKMLFPQSVNVDELIHQAEICLKESESGQRTSCQSILGKLSQEPKKSPRKTRTRICDSLHKETSTNLLLQINGLFKNLQELYKRVERIGLKDPTILAAQQRLKCLKETESEMGAYERSLQHIKEAASQPALTDVTDGNDIGSQLSNTETLLEKTKHLIDDSKEHCSDLLDLLKEVQRDRHDVATLVQKGENVISGQAAYMSKENVQRLIREVEEVKTEFSDMSAKIWQLQNENKRLQSSLKKVTGFESSPSENEVTTLIEKWLDVNEKIDNYIGDMQRALALWEKLSRSASDIDQWMSKCLSEQSVSDLEAGIKVHEETINQFSIKISEIQNLLHVNEPPLELQRAESALKRKMEQVKEHFSKRNENRFEFGDRIKEMNQELDQTALSLKNAETLLNSFITLDCPVVLCTLQEMHQKIIHQKNKLNMLLEELNKLPPNISSADVESLKGRNTILQKQCASLGNLVTTKLGTAKESCSHLLNAFIVLYIYLLFTDQCKTLVDWSVDAQQSLEDCFDQLKSRQAVEEKLKKLKDFFSSGVSDKIFTEFKTEFNTVKTHLEEKDTERIDSWLRGKEAEIIHFSSHCHERVRELQICLESLDRLQEDYNHLNDWLLKQEERFQEIAKTDEKEFQDFSEIIIQQREAFENLTNCLANQGLIEEKTVIDSNQLTKRYKSLLTKVNDILATHQAISRECKDFEELSRSTLKWITEIQESVSHSSSKEGYKCLIEEKLHNIKEILFLKSEGYAKMKVLRDAHDKLINKIIDRNRISEINQTTSKVEEQWERTVEAATICKSEYEKILHQWNELERDKEQLLMKMSELQEDHDLSYELQPSVQEKHAHLEKYNAALQNAENIAILLNVLKRNGNDLFQLTKDPSLSEESWFEIIHPCDQLIKDLQDTVQRLKLHYDEHMEYQNLAKEVSVWLKSTSEQLCSYVTEKSEGTLPSTLPQLQEVLAHLMKKEEMISHLIDLSKDVKQNTSLDGQETIAAEVEAFHCQYRDLKQSFEQLRLETEIMPGEKKQTKDYFAVLHLLDVEVTKLKEDIKSISDNLVPVQEHPTLQDLEKTSSIVDIRHSLLTSLHRLEDLISHLLDSSNFQPGSEVMPTEVSTMIQNCRSLISNASDELSTCEETLEEHLSKLLNNLHQWASDVHTLMPEDSKLPFDSADSFRNLQEIQELPEHSNQKQELQKLSDLPVSFKKNTTAEGEQSSTTESGICEYQEGEQKQSFKQVKEETGEVLSEHAPRKQKFTVLQLVDVGVSRLIEDIKSVSEKLIPDQKMSTKDDSEGILPTDTDLKDKLLASLCKFEGLLSQLVNYSGSQQSYKLISDDMFTVLQDCKSLISKASGELSTCEINLEEHLSKLLHDLQQWSSTAHNLMPEGTELSFESTHSLDNLQEIQDLLNLHHLFISKQEQQSEATLEDHTKTDKEMATGKPACSVPLNEQVHQYGEVTNATYGNLNNCVHELNDWLRSTAETLGTYRTNECEKEELNERIAATEMLLSEIKQKCLDVDMISSQAEIMKGCLSPEEVEKMEADLKWAREECDNLLKDTDAYKRCLDYVLNDLKNFHAEFQPAYDWFDTVRETISNLTKEYRELEDKELSLNDIKTAYAAAMDYEVHVGKILAEKQRFKISCLVEKEMKEHIRESEAIAEKLKEALAVVERSVHDHHHYKECLKNFELWLHDTEEHVHFLSSEKENETPEARALLLQKLQNCISEGNRLQDTVCQAREVVSKSGQSLKDNKVLEDLQKQWKRCQQELEQFLTNVSTYISLAAPQVEHAQSMKNAAKYNESLFPENYAEKTETKDEVSLRIIIDQCQEALEKVNSFLMKFENEIDSQRFDLTNTELLRTFCKNPYGNEKLFEEQLAEVQHFMQWPQLVMASQLKERNQFEDALSKLLVKYSVLKGKAELQKSEMERCLEKYDKYSAVKEGIDNKLTTWESMLKKLASHISLSCSDALEHMEKNKMFLSELESADGELMTLQKEASELSTICTKSDACLVTDGVEAVQMKLSHLQEAAKELCLNGEKKQREWEDVTAEIERATITLDNLHDKIPECSKEKATKSDLVELLDYIDRYEEDLLKGLSSLDLLVHRTKCLVDASETSQHIEAAPVMQELQAMQDRYKTFKEKARKRRLSVEAENDERESTKKEINDLKAVLNDLESQLPNLAIQDAKEKEKHLKELQSKVHAQEAAIENIMKKLQAKYCDMYTIVPVETEVQLEECRNILSAVQEKVDLRLLESKPGYKVNKKIEEIHTGLKNVEELLQQKSPSAASALMVQKKIWKELDVWHPKLTALDAEIQEFAEENPSEAQELMDNLLAPQQLCQQLSLTVEERSTLINRITTRLTEFDELIASIQAWIQTTDTLLVEHKKFDSAKSLNKHLCDLQMALEDSYQKQDRLLAFVSVLQEFSAVCDTDSMLQQLNEQNDKIGSTREIIVDYIQERQHLAMELDVIETEVKKIEKSTGKIRAILESTDVVGISLEEHLKNREVVLQNISPMKKTIKEIKTYSSMLKLPRDLYDSLIVVQKTDKLFQRLEDLTEVTSQQSEVLKSALLEADSLNKEIERIKQELECALDPTYVLQELSIESDFSTMQGNMETLRTKLGELESKKEALLTSVENEMTSLTEHSDQDKTLVEEGDLCASFSEEESDRTAGKGDINRGVKKKGKISHLPCVSEITEESGILDINILKGSEGIPQEGLISLTDIDDDSSSSGTLTDIIYQDIQDFGDHGAENIKDTATESSAKKYDEGEGTNLITNETAYSEDSVSTAAAVQDFGDKTLESIKDTVTDVSTSEHDEDVGASLVTDEVVHAEDNLVIAADTQDFDNQRVEDIKDRVADVSTSEHDKDVGAILVTCEVAYSEADVVTATDTQDFDNQRVEDIKDRVADVSTSEHDKDVGSILVTCEVAYSEVDVVTATDTQDFDNQRVEDIKDRVADVSTSEHDKDVGAILVTCEVVYSEADVVTATDIRGFKDQKVENISDTMAQVSTTEYNEGVGPSLVAEEVVHTAGSLIIAADVQDFGDKTLENIKDTVADVSTSEHDEDVGASLVTDEVVHAEDNLVIAADIQDFVDQTPESIKDTVADVSTSEHDENAGASLVTDKVVHAKDSLVIAADVQDFGDKTLESVKDTVADASTSEHDEDVGASLVTDKVVHAKDNLVIAADVQNFGDQTPESIKDTVADVSTSEHDEDVAASLVTDEVVQAEDNLVIAADVQDFGDQTLESIKDTVADVSTSEHDEDVGASLVTDEVEHAEDNLVIAADVQDFGDQTPESIKDTVADVSTSEHDEDVGASLVTDEVVHAEDNLVIAAVIQDFVDQTPESIKDTVADVSTSEHDENARTSLVTDEVVHTKDSLVIAADVQDLGDKTLESVKDTVADASTSEHDEDVGASLVTDEVVHAEDNLVIAADVQNFGDQTPESIKDTVADVSALEHDKDVGASLVTDEVEHAEDNLVIAADVQDSGDQTPESIKDTVADVSTSEHDKDVGASLVTDEVVHAEDNLVIAADVQDFGDQTPESIKDTVADVSTSEHDEDVGASLVTDEVVHAEDNLVIAANTAEHMDQSDGTTEDKAPSVSYKGYDEHSREDTGLDLQEMGDEKRKKEVAVQPDKLMTRLPHHNIIHDCQIQASELEQWLKRSMVCVTEQLQTPEMQENLEQQLLECQNSILDMEKKVASLSAPRKPFELPMQGDTSTNQEEVEVLLLKLERLKSELIKCQAVLQDKQHEEETGRIACFISSAHDAFTCSKVPLSRQSSLQHQKELEKELHEQRDLTVYIVQHGERMWKQYQQGTSGTHLLSSEQNNGFELPMNSFQEEMSHTDLPVKFPLSKDLTRSKWQYLSEALTYKVNSLKTFFPQDSKPEITVTTSSLPGIPKSPMAGIQLCIVEDLRACTGKLKDLETAATPSQSQVDSELRFKHEEHLQDILYGIHSCLNGMEEMLVSSSVLSTEEALMQVSHYEPLAKELEILTSELSSRRDCIIRTFCHSSENGDLISGCLLGLETRLILDQTAMLSRNKTIQEGIDQISSYQTEIRQLHHSLAEKRCTMQQTLNSMSGQSAAEQLQKIDEFDTDLKTSESHIAKLRLCGEHRQLQPAVMQEVCKLEDVLDNTWSILRSRKEEIVQNLTSETQYNRLVHGLVELVDAGQEQLSQSTKHLPRNKTDLQKYLQDYKNSFCKLDNHLVIVKMFCHRTSSHLLKQNEKFWVELENEVKSLQQRAMDHGIHLERILQAWITFEDDYAILCKELEGLRSTIPSTGLVEESEERLAERIALYKQIKSELVGKHPMLYQTLKEGKALLSSVQCPELKTKIAELENQYLSLSKQSSHELHRLETLLERWICFKGKSDELNRWLETAMQRLNYWKQHSVNVPQDLDTVRNHLTLLLEYEKEVDNKSSLKTSVINIGNQLQRLKQADTALLRSQLAEFDQQWAEIHKQLPTIREKFHQLQMEKLSSRQGILELMAWMGQLNAAIKEDEQKLNTQCGAVVIRDLLQKYKEYKMEMNGKQLTVEFVNQSLLQMSSDDVEGKRYETIKFAECLGDMNLEWKKLQATVNQKEYKMEMNGKQLTVEFVNQSLLQMSSDDVEGKRYETIKFAECLGDMNLEWKKLQATVNQKIQSLEDHLEIWTENENRIQPLSRWFEVQKDHLEVQQKPDSLIAAKNTIMECKELASKIEGKVAETEELKKDFLTQECDGGPTSSDFGDNVNELYTLSSGLSKQVSDLDESTQSVIKLWEEYEDVYDTVIMNTIKARYLLDHNKPLVPLLETLQKQVDCLQHLLDDTEENEASCKKLGATAENLKKECSPLTYDLIDQRVKEGLLGWSAINRDIMDQLHSSQELLQHCQMYRSLHQNVTSEIEANEKEWNVLAESCLGDSTTESLKKTMQDIEKLQVSIKATKVNLVQLSEAADKLAQEVDPVAQANINSEREDLSQRLSQLENALSLNLLKLQNETHQHEEFSKSLEALENCVNESREVLDELYSLRKEGTDIDKFKTHMLHLSGLSQDLELLNDQTFTLPISDINIKRVQSLNQKWAQTTGTALERCSELQGMQLQKDNFVQNCENWNKFLEEMEANIAVDVAGCYKDLQKQQRMHERFQADVSAAHQILNSVITEVLQLMAKADVEDRCEFVSKVTLLKEQWYRVIQRVQQKKGFIDQLVQQWQHFASSGRNVQSVLTDTANQLSIISCQNHLSIQQTRKLLEDTKHREALLQRQCGAYLSTLQLGKQLLLMADVVTEASLQEDLNRMQQNWEKTCGQLKERRIHLSTIVETWKNSEKKLNESDQKLQNIKINLTEPIPEMHEELHQAEEQSKELEDSLTDWYQSLIEVTTMKTDLSRYIITEDVELLKEQIEHLHRQWEELCLRVSLRKQEIADKLNAWIIFSEKNKELCEWLTQMESKVSQNADGSIEEMIEKLKKDYMEEINLFSENKLHLKQLGEQLLKVSSTPRVGEIDGKLVSINDRWQHLLDLIGSRVKKLEDTFVSLQKLDKNMSNLRTWLARIESELCKPVIYEICDNQEIKKKLNEQQDLQRDIEDHSPGVASVLHICNALLHDTDACATETECDSIQQTTTSLDRRWRNICTMSMERRMKIEETWHLWNKFLEDYSRFEDWLNSAEVAAANPNSSEVLYTNAKEELKKFEAFQRQVHERLTQLELINKQYRRLARENRTDAANKLKQMVHEGNQRWDNLQKRVVAILRRLKNFINQREEFEGTREGLLMWLTEMDLQLTNVEHFSESDTDDKMRQLNGFQQEITLNTNKIDQLIVFGEQMIQKSEPMDAVLIEDELEELHAYCHEVFGRVSRFHQRLTSKSLIPDDEKDVSDKETDGDDSKEMSVSWEEKVVNVTPPSPQPLNQLMPPAPGYERSGRETPVSVDSIPLEWDHTVDVGGSSSHEDEDEATYYSALSDVEITENPEAYHKMTTKTLKSTTGRSVTEPPTWHSPGSKEGRKQPFHPPDVIRTLISTSPDRSAPHSPQHVGLCSKDSLKQAADTFPEEEYEESLGIVGLEPSEDQSESLKIMKARTLSDELSIKQNIQQWKQLNSDLNNISSWLENMEIELEEAKKLETATDFQTIEQRIKKLKERQKSFENYRSLVLSVNQSSKDFQQTDSADSRDLQQRLHQMNFSWEKACDSLAARKMSLQDALLHSQEFHERCHKLLLWLDTAEERRHKAVQGWGSSEPHVLLHCQRQLRQLEGELMEQQPQVNRLQESIHLLDGTRKNCNEAKEKVGVIGSRLKQLLKQVSRDLESVQQNLDKSSASSLDELDSGIQTSTPLPSTDRSEESLMVTRSMEDSRMQMQADTSQEVSRPCSFFYRVIRAALPLQLLLLLLVLLACLIPVTEDDYSCTHMNNFARSFYLMLKYTNGPPPT